MGRIRPLAKSSISPVSTMIWHCYLLLLFFGSLSLSLGAKLGIRKRGDFLTYFFKTIISDSITVCTQLSRGIFALLGAVSADSFSTIHSYTNTYHMPFFSPWFPEKVYSLESKRNKCWIYSGPLNAGNYWVTQVPVPTSGLMDYALSLRPEYHQAILDVIAYYGWKNIIYIYDSHDGKICPRVKLEGWISYQSAPLVYLFHCKGVVSCSPKRKKKKKGKGCREAEGATSFFSSSEHRFVVLCLFPVICSYDVFCFYEKKDLSAGCRGRKPWKEKKKGERCVDTEAKANLSCSWFNRARRERGLFFFFLLLYWYENRRWARSGWRTLEEKDWISPLVLVKEGLGLGTEKKKEDRASPWQSNRLVEP